MAWFPDWAERMRAVAAYGLPATVVGLAWSRELLVLELDVPEAALPRSHAERGFPLHISLLFEGELLHNNLQPHAELLRDRWAGRAVLLNVEWVGYGGAAMLHPADPLASDPDLRALHGAGYFRDRQVHVSL
jgi:hypothetical protein